MVSQCFIVYNVFNVHSLLKDKISRFWLLSTVKLHNITFLNFDDTTFIGPNASWGYYCNIIFLEWKIIIHIKWSPSSSQRINKYIDRHWDHI